MQLCLITSPAWPVLAALALQQRTGAREEEHFTKGPVYTGHSVPDFEVQITLQDRTIPQWALQSCHTPRYCSCGLRMPRHTDLITEQRADLKVFDDF